MKSKKVVKQAASPINSPESVFTAVSDVLLKKRQFIEALELAGVKDAKVLLPEAKDPQIEEVVKIGIGYLIAKKKAVKNLSKVFPAKAITLRSASATPVVHKKEQKKDAARAKYLKPTIKAPQSQGAKLTVTSALTGLMRDKQTFLKRV